MQGPFTRLPRPPRQGSAQEWEVDKRELYKWFDRIWFILSGLPGIAWDIVSKAGSKLSDIETRTHVMLQSVLQADVDLSDTDLEKHIDNELAYSWDRNQCYPVNTSVDYVAKPGEHISVTCSSADITITLPDVALNDGMPIWVHKADATGYRVLTTVKNIKYQGSTMHLISNGTDWVIS